jgi:hypothetical protein
VEIIFKMARSIFQGSFDEATGFDEPQNYRTIALFSTQGDASQTVCIDFDSGERGRVGMLDPTGFRVRNIIQGSEQERADFVRQYLAESVGPELADLVVHAALNGEHLVQVYEIGEEKGRVITNIPRVLPLGQVVTYG